MDSLKRKVFNSLIDLFPLILFSSTIIFAIISYIFIDNQYFHEMVYNYKTKNTVGLLSIIFYLFIFSIPFLSNYFNYNTINLNVDKKMIIRYAYLSFFLCIIGNLLFFRFFYTNPEALIGWTESGTVGGLRASIKETQLPGITTMTQFAVPSIVLFLILYFVHNYKKSLFLIPIILLFGLLRAFFFAERLALIELIIPIFVLSTFYKKVSIQFIFIAFIFFMVFIWSFELFRSFANPWYYNYYDPISFLINRFFMYFATAVNNYLITFTYFEFENLMSGILAPFYQFSSNVSGFLSQGEALKEEFGSPEFNSPFYFGVFFTNFSIFAPIFIFINGFFVKLLYNNFLKMNFIGLYFFPIILISLLDVRIMYLLGTRIYFFYFIFFLIVFEIYIRNHFGKSLA